MSPKADKKTNKETIWINPIGGLGDVLMLSGVLKLVAEKDSSRRFNLIRRTNYLTFLKGHPAIAEIGFPPKDAKILGVDYWSMEKLGPGNQRPFQVLARAFGLKTPVEEQLYVHGDLGDDPILHDFIPWKKQNILIAPSSDSPRKAMNLSIWHNVAHLLKMDEAFVLQVGRLRDPRVGNSYSALGLTTPRQLLLLIKKCDAVITSDNYIMHASHLLKIPAVAIWGPTHHKVYGYPGQIHLQLPKSCGLEEYEECIGPSKNKGNKLYGEPCPHGNDHCMNKADAMEIYKAVKRALGQAKIQ